MEQKLVKVPFEVELAKRIQNKECEGRIVTRYGRNVRIICWDAHCDDNIVALIEGENGVEFTKNYASDGMVFLTCESECDLMIEIPEYMTFQDGDVLTYWPNGNRWCIFIYKSSDKDILSNYVTYDCDSRGNNILTFEKSSYTSILCEPSTEEEKQKLIEALKASKKPKAKEYLKRFFGIEEKQEYEFKPFDKVVCRSPYSEWFSDIFSHVNKDGLFACVGNIWNYCLPYNEQTAHLLGTTDNWEE